MDEVTLELDVLRSIYGADAIRLYSNDGDETVRYQATLSLRDDVQVNVLVSLPRAYPASSPPQLQLLSRYIGPFSTDPELFGTVLRTFISVNGVEWTPDTVCVFDGLQNVVERCTAWYEQRLTKENQQEQEQQPLSSDVVSPQQDPAIPPERPSPLDNIKIFESEAITDRKSVFVGRACRISHPDQVPLILNHLVADRRIARAAHPTIHAWRCRIDNVLHQDNDDDGESAAGGRLAHLLHILEVDNVLVIVTRYFGGVHLGPDRFKHINQAARNALESGGFLDAVEAKRSAGRRKGRH